MYISFSDRPDKGAPGLRRGSGPGRSARVSSVVIALGVVSMLTDISSESVAAILPLYVTGVLGLSMVAYGFIDGIYQGISALVRIAGGYAADRGDHPKWVAFFGYGISALARVGLLFASGFAALTSVLAIDRLGKGVRTAPRDALIAAASPPDDLGRSFGMHRMLDTIGAAIGPLLAFVILLLIPDGFSTIFVVSLAFAVVGVAVLGFVVPNLRPKATAATAATAAAAAAESVTAPTRSRFQWSDLRNPRLRRLLLVAALFGLLTVGDGFIYLVLQGRGSFAAQWFPLLYVGTNVVFLALALPIGRLADRVGRARIFVLGHAALLAAYVSAALPVTGAAITILCLVFLGTFYAATDGIIAALASEFTPLASRASGIAAAQTVVAVSRFLASVGFGFLLVFAGRTEAMVVISAALAVIILVSAWLLRAELSRRASTTGGAAKGAAEGGAE